MHMPLWNEIEGQTLDGFTLRKLLRSEGRTAWFSTEDPGGAPAVISVFEALNDEDAVQARLQAAARFEHPGLLVIRRIGAGRLDDESLVYAVMEPFDQTLADVLRDRTLDPGEAREVAETLLSTLEAVEGAGLYHGHVDASGVLGVGDNIKLRSDCLIARHADSDAPALAALLYNALTGRRFSSERDALQLPAPFATVVRAGVGGNGSLAAMRRALSGPAVTNGGAAAATPPAAAAAPGASSAAKPVEASPAARSVAQAAASPRATRKTDELEPRPRKRPGVAVAALVIMAIVLVAFWYAFKRPAGHTSISGEAPSAASQPKPAPAAAVPPAASPVGDAAGTMGAPETVKPAPRSTPKSATGPAAKPAPSSVDTGANQSAGAERSVWHVVAYTYTRQETAQHMAAELAAKYPQLEPQVFSPNGHAPFLVTLGGGMNRQEAFARREAARTAGMPSDTYAQNFRR
jgi:eukaryotic-like serine/threonine-protein kinase